MNFGFTYITANKIHILQWPNCQHYTVICNCSNPGLSWIITVDLCLSRFIHPEKRTSNLPTDSLALSTLWVVYKKTFIHVFPLFTWLEHYHKNLSFFKIFIIDSTTIQRQLQRPNLSVVITIDVKTLHGFPRFWLWF